MPVAEKITPLQRLMSYLMPIKLGNYRSTENPHLELLLYKNQYQLATEDALYSDGNRYLPFRKAFKKLPEHFWPGCQQVLVLGTGLGSAVQILRKNYTEGASFVLVDHDQEVLRLARKVLETRGEADLMKFIAVDAFQFVAEHQCRYDLICIDIFKNRMAPDACTQMPFLQAAFNLLSPGGYCIMNYISHDPLVYYQLRRNLEELYGTIKLVKFQQNIVLVAQTGK